jgi:hypothetical protein
LIEQYCSGICSRVSKSAGGNTVKVQVLSPVPTAAFLT